MEAMPSSEKVDGIVKGECYMNAHVALRKVSLVNQTYTCACHWHVFWYSEELVKVYLNGVKPETPIELIFREGDSLVPPLHFKNPIRGCVEVEVGDILHVVHIGPTGQPYVMTSLHVQFEALESMEVEAFPFDKQMLNIVPLVSRNNFNYVVVQPSWMNPSENPAFNFEIPFTVKMPGSLDAEFICETPLALFNAKPKLKYCIRLERKVGYYVYQLFIPLFLIISSTFASFFVPGDNDSTADRLSVSLTLFLVCVAYQYSISAMLPKTSILTFVDKYVVLSFLILSLIVWQNATVGQFEDPDEALLFDRVTIGCILGTWILTHVFIIISYQLNWLSPTWEQTLEDNKADDFTKLEALDENIIDSHGRTRKEILAANDSSSRKKRSRSK